MPDILIECNADEVAAKFNKAAKDIPDDVLMPVGEKLGDEALKLYRSTTKTWSHSVVFEKIVNVQGSTVEVLVGTDDFIYGIVNDGARIPAIEGKLMVFQANYAAKTTPGSLQSRRGGASGPLVFTRRVRARTIRARNFTEKIKELIDKKAPSELKRQVGRWVRKLK